MSLSEKFLPKAQYQSQVAVNIPETAANIYPFLLKLDFSKAWLTRWLFRIRGIPTSSLNMNGLYAMKFCLLESLPNEGLVLGLMGQFWTPSGKLQTIQPGDFHREHPEFAKVTWEFRIEPLLSGKSRLITETRIFCPNRSIQSRFSRYWFFVKPFSNITRLDMLRALKKEILKAQKPET